MAKFLTLVSIIIALFAGVIFGINRYLILEDPIKKADAIVAVSGGDTNARTDKAIELYQQGYAPLLVFSGAAKDPKSPSNAKVMKERAVTQGIEPGAILIDEASRDTRENALGVKAQLSEVERIILVTSSYHQRRANAEIKLVFPNVEIINAPAEDRNWSPYTWWLTPYGWWVTVGELVKSLF
jgi:uncharacterized SAM-binding protein YcdF (DUF218 family)